MSRRNNKYSGKKGKNQYQNSDTKYSPYEQTVNKDELADEAIFAFTMLRESDSSLSQPSEKFCYVISYQWYKAWQDYVSYNEVIDEKPYKRSMGVKNPGFINKNLLDETSGEGYFKLPKELAKGEYRYLDLWITKKVLDKDDYLTVDIRAWDFFEKKYGGYCVPRPIHNESNCNYNDVELQPLNILILQKKHFEQIKTAPNDDEAVRKRLIPFFKKIQLNSYWSMGELNYFLRTVVSESEFNGLDAENIQVNIWQASHYLTQEQIRKLIAGYVLKCKKGIDPGLLPFMNMMDPRFENKYLTHLYKSHRCLVVECKTDDESWMIDKDLSDEEPGINVKNLKGVCEFCSEKNLLPYSCICQELFYCSERCKYRDQSFHLNLCSRTYDSESDEGPEEVEEAEEKKEEIVEPVSSPESFFVNTLRGLRNIGNTCYMNASLQCLRCVPEFSAIFLQNQHRQIMRKKQKSENNFMLLKKASKLWREFSYDDEIAAEPWAFKQIMGYYYPCFKGWQQHDSQEFISYLLNGFHDELTDNSENEKDKVQLDLKKPEDYYQLCLRNGSSPIYENFLGLYRSEISCSHCNYRSPQYDSFLTVSLDLFQKPEEAFLEIFLVYNELLKLPKKLVLKVKPEMESLKELEKRVYEEALELDSNESDLVFATFEETVDHVFYDNEINLKEMETKFLGRNKRLLCYQIAKISETEINKLAEEEAEAKAKAEETSSTAEETKDEMKEVESQAENTEKVEEKEEVAAKAPHWSDFYICVPVCFSTRIKVPNIGLVKKEISFSRLLVMRKTDKLRNLHVKILEMMEILYPDLYSQINDVLAAEKISELEVSKEKPQAKIEKPETAQKNIKSGGDRPQSSSGNSNSKAGNSANNKPGVWKTRGASSTTSNRPPQNTNRDKKEIKPPVSKQEQEPEEDLKDDALINYIDNFPYCVRFINPGKRSMNCVFCKKKNCDYCKAELTIPDSLEELRRKAVAEGKFLIQIFWEQDHPDLLSRYELDKKDDRLQNKNEKPNMTTLLECIEFSSKPEILTEGNRWHCSECKELRDAEKRILLHYSPKYLIFHLKRFKSIGKGKREKNPQLINFPIDLLDLRKFVDGVTPYLQEKGYKEPIYELMGVVCHEGTLDNGHYYSYCRTDKSKWTKFDDSKVTDAVNENEVHTKHAYILFYKLLSN